MKKICTLFFGLMAAIMLFATPQTKLQPMSQTPATQLHPQAVRMLTQDLSKRALPATQSVERQATARHIAPIAKATAETITLNGEGFLVGPEYEAATREWYIALEAQGYTFRLCWYGDADTYCGTYTFDDISWDYTWGWYQSEELFYEIYPSDITMTISEEKVSECLKQIVLDATITDPNDNVYVVHSVHKMFTPKETIAHELSNAQVTIGDGQYVLTGEDDDLNLQLAVNSSTIEGAYTHANIDMAATNVVYNGVEQAMLQANLVVYCDYMPDGSFSYDVDFSFYNQDTVLHTISMIVPMATATDTVYVSCTNLSVDESLANYGIIMVSGSSELYDIFVMYEGVMAEAGVYENVSVAITDMVTWEMVQSISAKLTLTEAANGWEAKVEAYCSDYKWYSIDMKYVVPEPTDTVKISFDNAALATYNQYDHDMLQLLNYGEDYEASVTVYGIGVGEEFGMDNVLLDYSGVYDWSIERTVQIADIKGQLNQYGDTTVITASVIGFNAVQYDVTLWYTAPIPTDTVEIEMPVEFVNNMDYGYYTLKAYTPDETLFISVAPISSEVEGEFVNDGLFGKFGAEGGRYEFYAGETFIYLEADLQNYPIEKGTMVVEMASDGTLTAEAMLIARNAVCYHVKMTAEYNTHLDYDEPGTDVDRLYTTEDNVFIEDQTVENGYIYLSLTAADASNMAAFFFFAEAADEDIVIPVGVYPIDSSEDYGTVYANPGVQGDGVWPSYYAEMLEDGSIVVPLWLLVGGTVEVWKDEDANPHLEVNAVNSYGVNVHIVYDGTPMGTAVENTHDESSKVKCQKQLRDGQLLIIRNNETYNTMGARVE